jgi:hypothetical protein
MNELANILSTFIFNQLTAELEKQGHRLSGALIESFEAKAKQVTEDNLTIDFLMLNYGLSLNYGIKPKNIPYTIGGPRRGGTSKYIEGLIARKQKEQGYPLTGKIGFIDNVLLGDEKAIQEIIETHFEVVIQLLFTTNK